MEVLRVFLEQQPLLALFVVVGFAAGMLAPKAAPPALVGSLGLVLFVYGIGILYGKQFFRRSRRGPS